MIRESRKAGKEARGEVGAPAVRRAVPYGMGQEGINSSISAMRRVLSRPGPR
jgi:hypothetical protein